MHILDGMGAVSQGRIVMTPFFIGGTKHLYNI